MLILGWDTATAATTVALLDTATDAPRELRHDPAPGERPGHTQQLLPLLERVRDPTPWPAIDRLAAGTGPGSFTGLRVGLATARALALARHVPLVGVPTLDALAAAVAAEPEFTPERVLAVLDARRGEAWVAAYDHHARRRSEPRAVPVADLARVVDRDARRPLCVGDGAVRFRAQLESAGAVVPEDASPLHRVSAAWICRLAAGAGEAAPGSVLPRYGRAPDAVPRHPTA